MEISIVIVFIHVWAKTSAEGNNFQRLYVRGRMGDTCVPNDFI